MQRLAAACAWLVCASVCDAQPSAIAQEQRTKVGSVAVVSAIGEKLFLTRIGPTVFQNVRSEHAIADWRLDQEVESAAKRLLEKKYSVSSPENIKREEYGKVRDMSLFAEAPDYKAMAKALQDSMPGRQVDVFVVLAKHRAGEKLSHPNSNQSLEGVGIMARPVPVLAPLPGEEPAAPLPDRALSYAWYRIVVLSGATLEAIAERPAAIPNPLKAFMEPRLSPPYRLIEGLAYKREWSGYTEVERESIRRTLSDLLASSLSTTLKEMGFDVP